MIALLRPYHRRIAWAIALSALVHAALLWGPHLRLAAFDADLHPLTARLEPLPAAPKVNPVKKSPKPKTAQAEAKPSQQAAPASASTVAQAETVAAGEPALQVATERPVIPGIAATPGNSNKPALMPKHAQLIFAVHRGENGMYVGEIQHRLDISDGRYSIIAATRTTGLARWFKSYDLNQSSMGTVNENGLRPESFVEEKNDGGSLQNVSASFDWNAHVLHLSDGSETSLDAAAQDTLSLLYQFSAMPLRGEFFPLDICNGRKLEKYILEIVTEELTPTAMGDLRTLHLHKLHQPGESGMEIWLAMEYRLLPVKMQYVEPDGSVAATITITDIRVSDE